jgi:putative nucleotidyltransferase with HDIG domain
MSLNPTFAEQELLADTFRREDSRLLTRDRAVEALVGGSFLVAVAALWALEPPRSFALLPSVLCLLVLVLATRVRFDTPFGFTVATQLAFVPLLFELPVATVPVAVLGALMLARLPEVYGGALRPTRLLLEVGNAWFAVGPAAVFALAHVAPDDAGPALLVGALIAQFTVDFTVSTVRYWLERAATLSAQLRELWVYGIDAALAVIGLVIAEDLHETPIAALAPLPLLALLAVFARERHHRLQSLVELNTAYRGTALVLGDVVEADDGYTGKHCRSVVRLALALGDELGLGSERRRNLEFAALLHDVGKIAIPKAIINKPGKLDPDEWKIIETHTVEGQKMLDRLGGFMRDVGLIVRSHHERWDGAGYPDGLAGDAIPLEARIIACCDSWNAMRTDRAYRKALSHEVARTELLANAGRQFDPDIVERFLNVIDTSGEIDTLGSPLTPLPGSTRLARAPSPQKLAS